MRLRLRHPLRPGQVNQLQLAIFARPILRVCHHNRDGHDGMASRALLVHPVAGHGPVLVSDIDQMEDLLFVGAQVLGDVLYDGASGFTSDDLEVVFMWLEEVLDMLLVDFCHRHDDRMLNMIFTIVDPLEYTADYPRNNSLLIFISFDFLFNDLLHFSFLLLCHFTVQLAGVGRLFWLIHELLLLLFFHFVFVEAVDALHGIRLPRRRLPVGQDRPVETGHRGVENWPRSKAVDILLRACLIEDVVESEIRLLLHIPFREVYKDPLPIQRVAKTCRRIAA